MLPSMHVGSLGSFLLDYAGHPLRTVVSLRPETILAFLVLDLAASISRLHAAAIPHPISTEAQAPSNRRNPIGPLRQAVQIDTSHPLPDCYDNWIGPKRECSHLVYRSILEALPSSAEEALEYQPWDPDFASGLPTSQIIMKGENRNDILVS